MRLRVARAVLALYPLAFRRRYGVEMRALLDESPPGVLGVLDLLRSALGAHLRAPAGLSEVLEPGERVRASTSAVLACWVAFAAAGFGFYKTTEDGAGTSHPMLGEAHLLVQVLAVLGSFVLLLGALPLVFTALLRARREPGLRRIVSIPPLAVGCFAALTVLLVLLIRAQHSHAASMLAKGAFIAWLSCGLICGGVCVVFARRALFEMGVKRALLIVSFICATAVTAAMVAMTLVSGFYAVALALDAPQLADALNGPLGAMSARASLFAQTLAMAAASVIASITVRRGWRAARQLSEPPDAKPQDEGASVAGSDSA